MSSQHSNLRPQAPFARVVDVPGNRVYIAVQLATAPSPCCVFPLRLSGEPVVVTVIPGIHPFQERLNVVPTHRLHRKVSSTGEREVTSISIGEPARVCAHYALPLCLGHFVLP